MFKSSIHMLLKKKRVNRSLPPVKYFVLIYPLNRPNKNENFLKKKSKIGFCLGYMNDQQWPWHHKHSWKTKKNCRKYKKRGEVKNEGICWRCKPIYSLKQILGHKYSQWKCVCGANHPKMH